MPPERIVQTFEWEGMSGHVHVEHGGESGMNESHTRLDQLLARLASAEGGAHFLNRRAPR
jgi:hypothetical protein